MSTADLQPRAAHRPRIAAKQPLSERRQAEAAALMGTSDCPICHSIEEAERSYFLWFSNENHSEIATLMGVRAALGFCPAHTRRLAEQAGAGNVLGPVYRFVLPGARASVDEPKVRATCPACQVDSEASSWAAAKLRDGLLHDAPLDRYSQTSGVCVRHLLQLLPLLDDRAFRVVLEVAIRRVVQEPDERLVEFLAGKDADAERRGRLRAALPGTGRPAPGASAEARTRERLEVEACPSCLAHGQAERTYLSWLADSVESGEAGIANEVCDLCPAHLWDLELVSPRAAAWVARRARPVFDRDLRRLGPVGRVPGARATVLARLLRRPLPPRRLQLGPAFGAPCKACEAAADVEHADTALMLACLRQPALDARYRDSHGLCLRHFHTFGGNAPPAVRETIARRLAVLEWEVREAARKRAWGARHEPGGSEGSAWRRVGAQLDGRTYLGGPAL